MRLFCWWTKLIFIICHRLTCTYCTATEPKTGYEDAGRIAAHTTDRGIKKKNWKCVETWAASPAPPGPFSAFYQASVCDMFSLLPTRSGCVGVWCWETLLLQLHNIFNYTPQDTYEHSAPITDIQSPCAQAAGTANPLLSSVHNHVHNNIECFWRWLITMIIPQKVQPVRACWQRYYRY